MKSVDQLGFMAHQNHDKPQYSHTDRVLTYVLTCYSSTEVLRLAPRVKPIL